MVVDFDIIYINSVNKLCKCEYYVNKYYIYIWIMCWTFFGYGNCELKFCFGSRPSLFKGSVINFGIRLLAELKLYPCIVYQFGCL